MAHTITFFDREGLALADGSLTYSCSWDLNSVGQAQIEVPVNHTLAVREYLQHGNYVLIQDTDAGNWAGVLWTPRRWSKGVISLTAFTVEWLLKWRESNTDEIEGFANGIFQTLTSQANVPQDTLIRYTGGDNAGVEWTQDTDNTDLLSVLVKIAGLTGQDWSIEPVYEFGRLSFEAAWHYQRGTVTGVLLEEGYNVFTSDTQTILTEQGDIVNDLTLQVYQDGALATVSVTDSTSQADYGVKQQTIRTPIPFGMTKESYAQVLIDQKKNPRKTIPLSARNIDNLYERLQLGNQFDLRLTSAGFNDEGGIGIDVTVRLLAKQYEGQGVMGLVVEEVIV